MKKDFEVEIKEILSRVEVIKAESEGEAIDIAMGLYYDSKIILDANDYKGVDFMTIMQEEHETQIEKDRYEESKYI